MCFPYFLDRRLSGASAHVCSSADNPRRGRAQSVSDGAGVEHQISCCALLSAEGTYGVVHRARCKATGKIFALKKLKLESFQDGFPQTSVRELNVLLSLHHQNIVNVSEVSRGSHGSAVVIVCECNLASARDVLCSAGRQQQHQHPLPSCKTVQWQWYLAHVCAALHTGMR